MRSKLRFFSFPETSEYPYLEFLPKFDDLFAAYFSVQTTNLPKKRSTNKFDDLTSPPLANHLLMLPVTAQARCGLESCRNEEKEYFQEVSYDGFCFVFGKISVEARN